MRWGKSEKLALPRLAVVEHRHRVAADHDQLLLLERMQPRHEDVRALAAREEQVRSGHVGDLLVEVVAADGLYRFRLLADQRQDHRQVVRREAPQDVLFAPDLPEIEAVRIEILEPPQRALAHQFLQL